ncbi:MAG TPA: Gfo/Idh/MocA family oxidoreductase [Victivallales bacterium]|nr:Gfo/Idh/MocA family oxidoreductase [Victivallales bacterium]
MSVRKLKVGVIGVGALGRHHTRLYNESSNADLVGIYDANEETAKKISEEFGVSIFPTIEELADACEGISIAVPATLHHRIAIPLLNSGKHILMEKPLASSVQEAGELVKLAEQNGSVLEVGHTERYNPVMSFLNNKIENARFIEARRLAPYPPPRPGLYPRGTEVGVVTDLMIHDLELILHMVDSKVAKVEATGIPVLSKTEDIANARITFKNGCIANVTASRINSSALRRMKIFQSESYISLDYQEKTGFVYSKTETGIHKETVPIIDHNALQVELENFISNSLIAVETGKVPELKVSGKHGLEALRLAVKITEELHKHNINYDLYDGSPDSVNQF